MPNVPRPIQEMNEVKQFAELSMGWCINCHRNTKVNFPDSAGNEGNKFYSIYEKFHKDLKPGDSITVEKIGGTRVPEVSLLIVHLEIL